MNDYLALAAELGRSQAQLILATVRGDALEKELYKTPMSPGLPGPRSCNRTALEMEDELLQMASNVGEVRDANRALQKRYDALKGEVEAQSKRLDDLKAAYGKEILLNEVLLAQKKAAEEDSASAWEGYKELQAELSKAGYPSVVENGSWGGQPITLDEQVKALIADRDKAKTKAVPPTDAPEIRMKKCDKCDHVYDENLVFHAHVPPRRVQFQGRPFKTVVQLFPGELEYPTAEQFLAMDKQPSI